MTDESQPQDNAATAPPAGGEQQAQPNIEEILANESVRAEIQRMIQSEADKRVNTIEKRMQREAVTRAEDLKRQAEQAELQALRSEGNFTALGEKVANTMAVEETYKGAVEQVSGQVETFLLENPEFRVIGEDKVQELYADVKGKGGSVFDLMTALTNAKVEHSVSSLSEKIREDSRKELESVLAEHGLAKRSAAVAEGDAPSEGVSRQAGSNTAGTSDTQLLDAFNRGEDVPMATVLEILRKQGIDLGVKIPRK